MNKKATHLAKPAISYGALVGRVISNHRKELRLDQADIAKALRITQSAYSRLEQGHSAMSLPQLKIIAGRLGVTPSGILHEADGLANKLRSQSVEVTSETVTSRAAVLLGHGIMAALLLSKK